MEVRFRENIWRAGTSAPERAWENDTRFITDVEKVLEKRKKRKKKKNTKDLVIHNEPLETTAASSLDERKKYLNDFVYIPWNRTSSASEKNPSGSVPCVFLQKRLYARILSRTDGSRALISGTGPGHRIKCRLKCKWVTYVQRCNVVSS